MQIEINAQSKPSNLKLMSRKAKGNRNEYKIMRLLESTRSRVRKTEPNPTTKAMRLKIFLFFNFKNRSRTN